MGYTTEKSWAVADVLTASDMNTYVRDNVTWLATDKPHCNVSNSGAQTIADTTTTALTFNGELYDTGAMHDNSTNPTRITIPTGAGGVYLFSAQAEFASNATGYRQIFFRVNGSATFGSIALNGLTGAGTPLASTWPRLLVAGDYVEVCVIQTSGGNLNVSAATAGFAAMWMATG